MAAKATPQLLTSAQVRARLSISRCTLQRFRKQGILPAVSLPSAKGMLRFLERDVNALVRPA